MTAPNSPSRAAKRRSPISHRDSLCPLPDEDPFSRPGFEGPALQLQKSGKVSPTSARYPLAPNQPNAFLPSSVHPLTRQASTASWKSTTSSSKFIEDLPSSPSSSPTSPRMTSTTTLGAVSPSSPGLQRKGSLLSSFLSRDSTATPAFATLLSRQPSSGPPSPVTLQSPPTSSAKALSVLGSPPTKSAKAIATLTGIEVETGILAPVSRGSIIDDDMHAPLDTLASVRSTETTGHVADSEQDEVKPALAAHSRSHIASGVVPVVPRTAAPLPSPPGSAGLEVPPVPAIPAGVATLSRRRSSLSKRKPPTVPARAGSKVATGSGPVGALYLVSGLSRDPTHWQLAEMEGGSPSHSPSAVQRWWRPEVLGTTVAGEAEGVGLSSLDGRGQSKTSKRAAPPDRQQAMPARPAPQSAQSGRVLNKEEVARIQAKAMKLSFPRDVEVVASTVAPPATVHTFSFTITSTPEGDSGNTRAGAVAAAWDMANNPRPSDAVREQTFYASTLLIYSHADKLRTEAIRASLSSTGNNKTAAIARAIKAAGAGRKLGKKLETRLAAPTLLTGSLPRPGTMDTDNETEAYMTESEWEGPQSNARNQAMSVLPSNLPMWLPYALTVVSKLPIYDLMLDVLRISWARYHLSISDHSLSMSKFINMPLPEAGSLLKVPAGTDGSTYFACVVPTSSHTVSSAVAESHQVMWPLFRALSSDNILTICELALSPLGRIVLFSSHSMMLSVAVEAFKTILEPHGWNGIAHSAVHSRDVRLLLEDPGPYLLGLHSTQRPLANELAPEVLVVDLDTDRIQIDNPHPHALSRGGMRLRMRRRLEEAIGDVPYRAVPNELYEAFPGGRFRPFSPVEVNGKAAPAERLMPSWKFDQPKVLATFGEVLGSKPATGLRRLFFRQAQPRKHVQLDASTLHIQSIVRRHASNFVDRRDLLEARIGKLNRRLGYLMTESSEWKTHFDTFRAFSTRLDKESQDLKSRLEKEKKEARRLSGSLKEQESKRENLAKQLRETERARKAAESEIKRMEQVFVQLEKQRDAVVKEVTGLTSADEASLLVDGIFSSLDASSPFVNRPGTSFSDEAPRLGPSSPPLSSFSGGHRARGLSTSTVGPSNASEGGRARRAHPRAASSVGGQSESEFSVDGETELGDLERASLQREAVMKTMFSIQERLQQALRNAGLASTDVVLDDATDTQTGDTEVVPPRSPETNNKPAAFQTPATAVRVTAPILTINSEIDAQPSRPLTAQSDLGYESGVERSPSDDASDTEVRTASRTPMKGMRPFLVPGNAPTSAAQRRLSGSSDSSAPGRPKRSAKRAA